MPDDDAEVRRPRWPEADGETIGHVGNEQRIRRRDSPFLPGDEMGRIGRDGTVRKRADVLGYEERLGQVRGKSAYGNDGILPGEEWGYVDENGIIWLKEGTFGKRQIGEARGKNRAAALAYFVLKFEELEEECRELESEVRGATRKSALRRKVEAKKTYLGKARALGDFDRLRHQLDNLIEQIDDEESSNLRDKQNLVYAAEAAADETDWKRGEERFADLHDRWKGIGPVPQDYADEIWNRFRNAQQRFFARKNAFFDERRRLQDEALRRKEELCREAEALADSTDWKRTGDQLASLMGQWKVAGRAPRDQEDELWERFQEARKQFFDRRSDHFDARNREMEENRREKEALIAEVEAMRYGDDLRAACERVKEVQGEWKAVGHVRKEDADDLWNRFRSACDAVYSAARDARQDRMRETLDRKREQAGRLRESIAHDEGNVERWDDLLETARGDDFRESLEEKIPPLHFSGMLVRLLTALMLRTTVPIAR